MKVVLVGWLEVTSHVTITLRAWAIVLLYLSNIASGISEVSSSIRQKRIFFQPNYFSILLQSYFRESLWQSKFGLKMSSFYPAVVCLWKQAYLKQKHLRTQESWKRPVIEFAIRLWLAHWHSFSQTLCSVSTITASFTASWRTDRSSKQEERVLQQLLVSDSITGVTWGLKITLDN